MRITREQTEKNRDRIVAAAAQLFGEHGFDGVGVVELMQAAGLTHGGFYNHFDSKEALESAVCDVAFETAVARLEQLVGETATAPRKRSALAAYVGHYLSGAARDAPAPRCPMVALTGDAVRHGPDIRRRFAAGFQRYIDALAGLMGRPANAPRAVAERLRKEAIVLTATLVGAQLLARAVKDADIALSDDILATVQQATARRRA
ncbi:MAG TPA: TetR/AcrR family transcriptional regulator [Stellaceae bacterium]|nr:TetR/AcrR family transcriptional regulator [Stellaceae bacterium]